VAAALERGRDGTAEERAEEERQGTPGGARWLIADQSSSR